MSNLKSILFKLFPESGIKNRIRCFFYNLMQKDFRIKYLKGLYHVEFTDFELKFYENPFHLLMRDRDYSYNYKLQAGDVVIDAGAFYGVYTAFASKKVGDTGKVFALEPDPETYEIVKKNIGLNELKNVTLLKKGLWSVDTVLSFEPGKELGSTFIVDERNGKNYVSIPVATVDTILKDVSVKNNVFIKMNIEGSEIEAVKGAGKTIEQYSPYFCIRTNHNVDGYYTDSRVEKELQAHGYNTKSLVLVELTTIGWKKL